MRTEDCRFFWAATPLKELQRGVAVGGNTRLRRIFANMQYLDNAWEQRLFGKISNTTVQLRTKALPDVKKGDVLYLEKPDLQGQFTVAGETFDDYGRADFEVLSVVPAYAEKDRARNPTTITAKLVT